MWTTCVNRFVAAALLLAIASPETLDAETIDDERSSREHLLGDWGGLRDELTKRGVDVELVYTGEFLANVGGGIEDGADYRGDLSLTIELSTADAGWWSNGTFFTHLQHQHGNGISEDYVGDFQVVSNIDADDFTQVSEFWYQHEILQGRLTLKLGKMESNEDFAFVDYGGEFLNSSAGFSPTIPLVTYPDPDWGMVLGLHPREWLTVKAGVYQGRPDGGRSPRDSLDSFRGPMVLLEPSFHYQIAGKDGHLRLGTWFNGDRFEDLDGNGSSGSTAGYYATWDQHLYSPADAGETGARGLGVFGQLGFSDSDRMEAETYVGAGLQWTGPTPTRESDVAGLAVYRVEFSDDAGFEESAETAFELFYKLQLEPWFSIKSDVQFIDDPGGSGLSDTWVVGTRVEVSF